MSGSAPRSVSTGSLNATEPKKIHDAPSTSERDTNNP